MGRNQPLKFIRGVRPGGLSLVHAVTAALARWCYIDGDCGALIAALLASNVQNCIEHVRYDEMRLMHAAAATKTKIITSAARLETSARLQTSARKSNDVAMVSFTGKGGVLPVFNDLSSTVIDGCD